MIPFMSGTQVYTLAYTGLTAKTVSGATIVVPATALAGDLAILFEASQGTTNPVAVPNAGWTVMQGTLGLLVRMQMYFKILVAGDLGATLTGMNADVANFKMILIFRPTRTITAFSVFDTNAQIVATAPTNQTLPVATYTPPILCLAHMATGNADLGVTGDSMTPAADGSETNGIHHKVAYKIYNSSPASETVAMGDAGAINGLQSNDSLLT